MSEIVVINRPTFAKQEYSESINIFYGINDKLTKRGLLYHFYHFYHDFLMVFYYYCYLNNLLGKKINLYMPKIYTCGNLSYIAEIEIPHLRMHEISNRQTFNREIVHNKLMINGSWKDNEVMYDGKEIINVWNNRPTTIPYNSIKNPTKHVLLIDRGLSNLGSISKSAVKSSRSLTNGKTRRSIQNMDSIEEEIKRAGYYVNRVTFEDLTFREQQKVFERVDIVIGQHGAGLVHLLDVKRNIKLIELPPILGGHYKIICKRKKEIEYIDGSMLRKGGNKNHPIIDVKNLLKFIN